MSAQLKVPHSDFDTSSRGTLTPTPPPALPGPRSRFVSAFANARASLNLVSLAASLAVLGLAAHSIAVYNETHLADGFLLALWPRDLHVASTRALLVVATLVVVFSGVSVAVGRTQNPGSLRFTAVLLALPVASFIAAIVAVIVHFAANSSSSNYTLETWTCRWKDVSMTASPHFGSLCYQTKASIGLMVALVPLQVFIMASVVATFMAEKAVRWSEKK